MTSGMKLLRLLGDNNDLSRVIAVHNPEDWVKQVTSDKTLND
jgi:hypothetical protein